jgi:diacylglycerol kinase family enzyme
LNVFGIFRHANTVINLFRKSKMKVKRFAYFARCG